MGENKSKWTFGRIVLLSIMIFLMAKIILDFFGFWSTLSYIVSFVFSTLGYILVGFAVAYVLSSYTDLWEKKILKRMTKHKTARRNISIVITYISLAIFIALLAFAIIPTLVQSMQDLGDKTSQLFERMYKVYFSFIDKINLDVESGNASNFNTVMLQLFDSMEVLYKRLLGNTVSWFSGNVTSWAVQTAGVVFKVIMGLIVSIYMLIERENSFKAFERILNALFKKETVHKINWAGKEINSIFKKYFVAKIIQVLACVAVAYVAFTIIGSPYALVFAITVGIFNMIPYIGPWIGAVLPIMISLLYGGFWTGVSAAICVMIVQTCDNYIVSPKLVGKSIGISPLLVLIGLAIGGSLFGLPGLVMGDVMAAIFKLFFYDTYIENKLKKRMALAAADSANHQLTPSELLSQAEADSEANSENETANEEIKYKKISFFHRMRLKKEAKRKTGKK